MDTFKIIDLDSESNTITVDFDINGEITRQVLIGTTKAEYEQDPSNIPLDDKDALIEAIKAYAKANKYPVEVVPPTPPADNTVAKEVVGQTFDIKSKAADDPVAEPI